MTGVVDMARAYCLGPLLWFLEGFILIISYGNQPRPFEVVFQSTDTTLAALLQNKTQLSDKHIV